MTGRGGRGLKERKEKEGKPKAVFKVKTHVSIMSSKRKRGARTRPHSRRRFPAFCQQKISRTDTEPKTCCTASHLPL